MLWLLIIVLILLAFLMWILLSPLVLVADTRIPEAEIKWKYIGSARIWFDNDWWLFFRIFFFSKKMRFADIKSKKKKIEAPKKKKAGKKKPKAILNRIISVLRSFRVKEWQLAVDTGDYTQNARLFPLNFAPFAMEHAHINFMDENYLFIKIRGVPWKIAKAFFK